MHDDVTTAWDRAIAQWEDPARHEALIAAVVQHNSFAWAAQRYKERAGDPIADKQLERLRKAAVATMFAASTARRAKQEPAPYRKVFMWILVLVIFAILGLVFTRLVLDNTPPKANATTPARP